MNEEIFGPFLLLATLSSTSQMQPPPIIAKLTPMTKNMKIQKKKSLQQKHSHSLTFSTVRDHNPFQLSGEDKITINPQPSTFFFLDYHHPSSLITSRHRSFFIVRPRLPSLIVRKRGLRYIVPSLFLKISIIFIIFSSPFSSLSFIVDCFFFHSDFSSIVS